MQFERMPFKCQRGRGEASIFTADNFQKARDLDISGVALYLCDCPDEICKGRMHKEIQAACKPNLAGHTGQTIIGGKLNLS